MAFAARRVCFRLGAGLALVLVMSRLPGGGAWAQVPREFSKPDDYSQLEAAREGRKKLADVQGTMKQEVRHLLHRLLYPPYNGKPATSGPKIESGRAADELLKDLQQEVMPEAKRRDLAKWNFDPRNEAGTETTRLPLTEAEEAYFDAFGKMALAEMTKNVLPQATSPYTRILALRMINVLTTAPVLDWVDPLLAIARSETEPDAVKYYANLALGNVVAHANFAPPGKALVDSKLPREKQAEVARHLIGVIGRVPPGEMRPGSEEATTHQFLRRAAVQSLAQFKNIAVRDLTGKILELPGLWLLRVAAGDPGLMPAPSPGERADALAGFLAMVPDDQMNLPLVQAALLVSLRDLVEFQGGDNTRMAKAKLTAGETVTVRPILPWKAVGAQLNVSLSQFRIRGGYPYFRGLAPALSKVAADVHKVGSDGVASKFEAGAPPTPEAILQGITDLKKDVETNPTLFKGVPDSFVWRQKAEPTAAKLEAPKKEPAPAPKAEPAPAPKEVAEPKKDAPAKK
jgi:hypothetical protein